MLTGPMTRIALAAAVIALAGCGTKTTPASQPPATTAAAATTPAVTHAEFVKALNASCDVNKPRQKQLSRQFESAMERSELPKAAGIYETMLTMVRAHTRRAAAMDPPAADRAAYRRYMAAQRRIEGIGARLARAMAEDDMEEVARLTPLFAKEGNRRLTAAIDIGADKCGT